MSHPHPRHDPENERTDDDLLRQEDEARRREDKEEARKESEQTTAAAQHERDVDLTVGTAGRCATASIRKGEGDQQSRLPNEEEAWREYYKHRDEYLAVNRAFLRAMRTDWINK